MSMLVFFETSSHSDHTNYRLPGGADLWETAGVRSGAHAPQHFLYFLPLPHGHRSFLPIFGAPLMIWEAATPRFGLVFDGTSVGLFAPFRLLP